MSNVLVYSGTGVSSSALSHTLKTLRQLLPSYDVQCVNARSLALDPWMSTTSLLVIPGGRDLPYVDLLGTSYQSSPQDPSSSRADANISHYVRTQGGNFLGICAGAYYASSYCDFEKGDEIMQVAGDRTGLQFYPGTCKGTVFPGFVYESDKGARIVQLQSQDSSQDRWTTYYNGGGAFMNASDYQNQGIEVLATYMTEEGSSLQAESCNAIKQGFAGQAAIVRCRSGKGKALLYGTHPEFPLTANSSPMQTTASAPETLPSTSVLQRLEAERLRVFGQQLQSLGLEVKLPSTEIEKDYKLSPILLTSRIPGAIHNLVKDLESVSSSSVDSISTATRIESPKSSLAISDSNDTIHIHNEEDLETLFRLCREADYAPYTSSVSAPSSDEARAGNSEEVEVDLNKVPKCIIALNETNNRWHHLTPHWNASKFYHCVQESRRRVLQNSQDAWATGKITSGPNWGMEVEEIRLADTTAYGQVVTSTQTMLDKNYKLLTHAPNGFSFFATHQMSGRGRGKNAWISPLGCLQFSTVLHFGPTSLGKSGIGGVVFVQYLAGLAIVESVRSGILGSEYSIIGKKMRIKWPNDVYAEIGSANEDKGERKGTFVHQGKRLAKIAGVLVNSQFAGKQMSLVVGCGINTLNPRPTTSLSDLIQAHNQTLPEGEARLALISQEEFAGAILATFEKMWNTFIQVGGSFEPFIEAYRRAWLHSDQITTLSDTNPPTSVKIVGITSDHGLLRSTTALGSTVDTYSTGSWSSSKVSGQWIDLQPDGNSFDMLQNLIRRKE